MGVSVEWFFLINQAADFSILAAVSRGFGAFRLGRVGLAATLCACYAVLTARFPALASTQVQLALLIPVAMLTAGRAAPARAAPCALAIAAAALVAGACAEKWRGPAALWVLTISAACGLWVRGGRRGTASASLDIEVVNRGACVRFPAWLDTGNRLTEPFSGQPVLVASAPLVRRVLPSNGYRLVAYGSLGGSGTLRCFRPERIYISRAGRRRRAPEAWIAVVPRRLPGPAQALAPAEFAFE